MIFVISAQIKAISSDFLPFFQPSGHSFPKESRLELSTAFITAQMARDVRIQMSHQGKLSGRLIQTRRTVIFTAADTLSILNRIVEDRLRVSSPLTCLNCLSKMDKEYIGDCRKVQSELIRTHPIAGGAVGKQIKLLLFDAILHIAACAVDIFIQRLGIPFFSRDVSHNKAGILLAPADVPPWQ